MALITARKLVQLLRGNLEAMDASYAAVPPEELLAIEISSDEHLGHLSEFEGAENTHIRLWHNAEGLVTQVEMYTLQPMFEEK